MNDIDPRRDLILERVIRATPEGIWNAWTTPALLERRWIPAPAEARVEKLEVAPGGAFVTSMREGAGEYQPHTDGVFLVVETHRRLVFTNVVDSAWRPASPEPVGMTAEISLEPDPEGTAYRVVVRHRDPSVKSLHEELGFFDGWGSVTASLAELVEGV